MRELSVSIGVIRQQGEYVLQRRGDDPRIGAAGLIGAFGGKIESGEAPHDAVVRELSEETTLEDEDMTVRRVASYDVVSDNKLEEVIGHIEAFLVAVDASVAIRALEGTIVRLRDDQVEAQLAQMTPATRYYFEHYQEEK